MPAPVNSVALQVLQQTSVLTLAKEKPATGDVLLAAVNGVEVPGASDVQSRAKAKVSESLFDSSSNPQQVRIDLMRRFGKELGLDLDDYKNLREFGDAARQVIHGMVAEALQLLPPDKRDYFAVKEKIHTALEEKLGFDQMDISIEDVFAAIENPDGEEAAKLDAALAEGTGAKHKVENSGEGEDGPRTASPAKTDDNGLYSPRS